MTVTLGADPTAEVQSYFMTCGSMGGCRQSTNGTQTGHGFGALKVGGSPGLQVSPMVSRLMSD